eukprot:g12358.t1
MFDKMIKEQQKHNSEQNAKLMVVLRPTKPTGRDQDRQPASNELVIVTRTPTGTEDQVHSVNGGSPNGGELMHYNHVHNLRNGGKVFRLQPQEVQVDAFAHQSALLPVMAYHNMVNSQDVDRAHRQARKAFLSNMFGFQQQNTHYVQGAYAYQR